MVKKATKLKRLKKLGLPDDVQIACTGKGRMFCFSPKTGETWRVGSVPQGVLDRIAREQES